MLELKARGSCTEVSRSMAHQASLRHVPNDVPDYDAFIASLQLLEQQPQQPVSEGGSQTSHTPSFLSTTERGRLQETVRSWLLQSIQQMMKAWPPSSPESPTSVTGETEEDFSVYVGTSTVRQLDASYIQINYVKVWSPLSCARERKSS